MEPWITTSDLRNAAGAKMAIDEDKFVDAVAIACGKVEEMCGPIAWATVTDELVPASRAKGVLLKYRATRGLTAVSTDAGVVLDVDDFRVSGRLLKLKDGGRIGTALRVSYETGYFDPTEAGATAPTWARSMAKLIGHQYLRIERRFKLDSATADDLTQTHFLVPAVALDVGRDYLLTHGGL